MNMAIVFGRIWWSGLGPRLDIFVLNANAKHMGWDCVRAKNDFPKCIGCRTVYSF